MKQEPTTPQFFDDKGALYSYQYFNDNFDKIFYSKGDEELKEDMLNYSSTLKVNDKLAGDIDREFEIEDKQLLSRLEQMICKHLSQYIGQTITEINIINPEGGQAAWINYMRPTEYNPHHDHSGFFSFVWYLDIPEEIREEWKDSHGISGTRGCIQFFSQVVAHQNMVFNPQTNDLFLFTSGHQHQVYPYYSDNTRISISGNVYEYK